LIYSVTRKCFKLSLHSLDVVIVFATNLFFCKVLDLRAHAEASKQKGVDGLRHERGLRLFAVLVHRVSNQIKRGNGIFQMRVVLVVSVREKEQLQILYEVVLFLRASYGHKQSREELLRKFNEERID